MLPDIKTILFATDLSVNSEFACRYAVYLAEKTDAKIHVLHIAEKLPAEAREALEQSESWMEKFETNEQFHKDRLDNSKRLLTECFDRFWQSLDKAERKLRNHISSMHVIESQPAEAIVQYAEKIEADMIVMGTHQKGAITAFLGSISRRVLKTATIPMLVVPIGNR